MRIIYTGLLALSLSTTIALGQSPDQPSALSQDAAAGAAALGLDGPPSQSDRGLVLPAQDEAAADAPASPAPVPAQAAAPEPVPSEPASPEPVPSEPASAEPVPTPAAPAAAQEPSVAPDATGATDVQSIAPATPAAAAPQSDAGDTDGVETEGAEATAPDPDEAEPNATPAADAADAADANAGASALDDEAMAARDAATAAGALGITSPPEQADAGPDSAAVAAGALGITSPPEESDGADPAAVAAGALGITSAPENPEDDLGAAATAAGALGLTSPPASSTSDDALPPDASAAAAGALGIAPPTSESAPAGAGAASYRVAILDDAPPFSFTGRFRVRTGFDVDLANALCRTLKARCEVTPMAAEDLVQALVDRRVAFAVATPAITSQPAVPVSFSAPYLSLSVRFVTPATLRRDVEDDDARYGALIGTSQAAYLRRTYTQPQAVHLYPNADGMWIDLALGRLDGVLAPAITARREFLATPIGSTFQFAPAAAEGENILARAASIGIRAQDPDLVATINAALAEVKASGEFAEILARHLDRDLVDTVD